MSPSGIPRLVIAGVASGVGKTTTVVALTRALRARGLQVATFKCGPDYLDPTFHASASGAPCHNLDGWMMGREAVVGTFARASRGADVALIEGVMGLFDGASPDTDDGSAAQVARWLGAPVLAVVDASGMARTIAAVGHGLASFHPEVKVAGLWANRVGSKGHLELLQRACVGTGTPVVGGLPERPELAFPERHLGLVTAQEGGLSPERLEAWGSLVSEWCDLNGVLRLAASAGPLEGAEESAPVASPVPVCRIAVAQDEAFHFYYEDNLRRLEALGAELVPFSPVRDGSLPRDVHALYLGGGYPEVHAAALAGNSAMLEAVRAFAHAGGPVYAECGGMMYLAQGLRTLDGREHTMVGLVSGVAVMAPKLQALGYVEVETTRRTVLGGAGLRFRGHQFRYSTLEGAPGDGGALRVRRRRGDSTHQEGYGPDNVLASYVHAHWASNPLVAEGFVRSARAFREGAR
ncbi:cobyrinate a,c-diamide synthase [Pyxidicoccus fallax]|uniref:Cobyrinate a,c-diamide synthase n=1 Tax=Pyxidicoccus fallax TaxID=394095 RepID=A0A848LHC2_9BACT|nr:cobyrinate a,c-diamide synthase [Pyxidicoccus fallax]NMO16451.1 cobyrinate a,c-diamide synthase [Pyxidicoccus fallax]NPC79482.1 cobyrinate a,c-diamide synthase [Pyxidicoccus fallax]